MAELTEIKATKEVDDVERSAVIHKDLGSDINDAVEKFGADVVHSNFKSKAKIVAQAAMRRLLEAGKTQDEVVEAMKVWKPGVALERVVDPVASLLAKFGGMNAGEQDALLAKLKAAKGKK